MTQSELIAHSGKNKNKGRARFCEFYFTPELYDFVLGTKPKRLSAKFCEVDLQFSISTVVTSKLKAQFCEAFLGFEIKFAQKQQLDLSNFCKCVIPTEVDYTLIRQLDEAGFCKHIWPLQQ